VTRNKKHIIYNDIFPVQKPHSLKIADYHVGLYEASS